VALIGEANHLVITDRIKDVIIRGGETMSSKAIEDVLTALPAIAEAAVVGAPDDRLGERVCAFIVVAPGQQVELPDIARHFAEAGVARQKTPERLEIVQELPRNSGGKVVKAQLRQLLG
jgi:non-ribosomal peptide synthetase component E (peptide arylation enzyme)